MRTLLFLLAIIVLAGCANTEEVAAPVATAGGSVAQVVEATVTAVSTATAAAATPSSTPRPASATPRPATAAATATAEPAVQRILFTSTPYPGATPTSGPLNTPVPPVPRGEYECGGYPCRVDVEGWEEYIAVPPGFEVDYFALVDPYPTSMTFGPDGLLYVARQQGEIVTVDAEGQVTPYMEGFYQLVSLAFQPGTERLFASSRAEGDKEAIIWVIEDGEATPLYEDLPCCYGGWHQANGIAFGPDGYGYVGLGARSDHGTPEPETLAGNVLRFDPNGGEIEIYAQGLRNTFDLAWDGAGRLFGADNMPDYGPPEEFNQIEAGKHYGFPYYDCDDCTPRPPTVTVEPPLHELLAHSAPTGVTAYLAEQFPGYYNNLFLTLWSAFEGAQKVIRFSPGGEEMSDFAMGFGAPVDVTVAPEGSLYVLDWETGIIFKISYVGQ